MESENIKKYLKYKKKYLKRKSQQNQDIENFKTFLIKLYKFLNDKDICFDKGAFIFELPDNSTGIINTVYKFAEPRMLAKTHNYFENTNNHSKAKLCQRATPNNCPTDSPIKITSEQQKEINMNFISTCKRCQEDGCKYINNVDKGVALMYRFTVVKNAVSKTYMYLKLEEHSTTGSILTTINHGIQAVNRYLVKNDIEQSSRREDSYKDYQKVKKESLFSEETNTIVNKDNKKLISHIEDETARNALISKINEYTQYLRTGRELFIPNEIFTHIIETS